jgi:hypothetical protein
MLGLEHLLSTSDQEQEAVQGSTACCGTCYCGGVSEASWVTQQVSVQSLV